ncbi:conjugative transposon protein TraJ [Mucilaginibacter paludis]|uniref:Conjugative transposon TraJ protein n=1 Tax=Mucilaginibacter paludis DSM 18603 TaxID=714943 RepID=H1XZ45_9SPHI|nr:conjugative transposon protein TraJ [Mucilaginibacter paludis]EHQ24630.1 conjugative transposon TraJ protein [Mucilaginibacter paludis DSM 18603]
MDNLTGLQATLEQVYSQMLPLCSQLIGPAQGIAGFAALWYIASRVWRSIAAAEPIDFYPLLKPFALGLCIMLFPTVIAIINGIMQPVVSTTNTMVTDSNAAIALLLEKKTEAEKKTQNYQMFVGPDGEGDRNSWYKYTHPDDPNDSNEGMLGSIGNDMRFAMAKASYNFRNSIKEWMSEVLQVLYEAAALCINTVRTFQLIVLAILGPLVFGIAVFDGFQHTLTVWMARYINVFLWLPVANIFGSIIGKVQQNMLALDISQIQSTGDTFFSSGDVAYLIFLLIGIVGYFTVPSTANYIVHAGGGNTLVNKINSLVISSSRSATSAMSGGMQADAYGNQRENVTQSMAANSLSEGYFRDKPADNNNYKKDKLKGDK